MSNLLFGVQMLQDTADYPTIRNYAREAERAGYDSIWVADHLLSPIAARHALQLESWTLLTALAIETKRVHLGALVLNNTFRNPALLAKMAASLDHISNGRLEFAIGSGWYDREHLSLGYPFDPPSVRSARLDEGVEICKRMWTEKRPAFEGKYYRIDNAVCEPKPTQKPHPPIWMGGLGEKFTLPIVAKHASNWNCSFINPEEIVRKRAVLNKYCADLGRDPNEITNSWYGHVIVDERGDIGAPLERMARQFSVTEQDMRDRLIGGSPDQCVAYIEELADAGISYFTVTMGIGHDHRQLTLFADKVISRFR